MLVPLEYIKVLQQCNQGENNIRIDSLIKDSSSNKNIIPDTKIVNCEINKLSFSENK
jgi:hypothetical protein